MLEAISVCAADISHLHHYLSKNKRSSRRLIDIAFAPIDGIWQISHDGLFRVLGVIKARMVIPMYFGSAGELEASIARARDHWEIRRHNSDSIPLSIRTMPRTPEVLFFRGSQRTWRVSFRRVACQSLSATA